MTALTLLLFCCLASTSLLLWHLSPLLARSQPLWSTILQLQDPLLAAQLQQQQTHKSIDIAVDTQRRFVIKVCRLTIHKNQLATATFVCAEEVSGWEYRAAAA